MRPFPRLCLVTALATAFAIPSPASASRQRKIENLLDKDKSDKAWELCQRWLEDSEPSLLEEREICAEAHIRQLRGQSAEELSLEALDWHWQTWPSTIAGTRSREGAAERRLVAAGEDGKALGDLVREFGDTTAGVEAQERLWQQALAEGTSDAMKRFVAEFPDAPQAPEARDRELEFAYLEAESGGTSTAWREFQTVYPDHPRTEEARTQELACAYAEAEATGGSAAWSALLEGYPEHPRHLEADLLRIEALFTEAEAEGIDALLATVQAHPDHPVAPEKRAAVVRRLTTVTWLARGNELLTGSLPWEPVAESDAEPAPTAETDPDAPALVPGAVDQIRVTIPEVGVLPEVELSFVVGPQHGSFEEGYRVALEAQGFDAERAGGMVGLSWNPPDGPEVSGLFAAPLCQPGAADTRFVLVVRAAGEEMTFPFRIDRHCADILGAEITDATLQVMGRQLRFGSSPATFERTYPAFTLRPGRENETTRVTTYSLEGGGGRGGSIRLDYHRDMLVRISVDGGFYDECYDPGSDYNTVRPEITAQLGDGKRRDTSKTDMEVTVRYRRDTVLAYDYQWVSGTTGDPSFHFEVGESAMLKRVRKHQSAYARDLK
jgi:hypothetical protein